MTNFWFFCPPSLLDKTRLPSFATWMKIPFFFLIVKAIIDNLAAFSSGAIMWDLLFPWDHGQPVVCPWHDGPNPGLMHLNLLSIVLGENIRTSHYTDWDFVYTNEALRLLVLIDSNASLENLFPEFADVEKPRTAELLELLLLWAVTALLMCLVPWPIIVTSLEALCIGFLSFPLSLVAEIVSYSLNLLILLETPKLMSDPTFTFECWLKTQSSEAGISKYPKELRCCHQDHIV